MVNLIKKDFIVHKKALLGMALGIIAYMMLNVNAMWVTVVFAIVIVAHIFSYDEKKPIQLLLSSLPYTRREVVSSKYISALMYVLLVLAVTLVSDYVINRQLPDWKQVFMIAGIVITFVSIYFPFSYKFKSNYLMIGTIVLGFIYMLIINLLGSDIRNEMRELSADFSELSDVRLLIGISVILIVLYFISWMLSIRIYEKKIF